ncbi:MAG: VCBS repeat-containing protein, partial [Myxococcota bacterium]
MGTARSMPSPARWIRTGGLCLSLASPTLAGAAEAPFELFEIPSQGRTVAAEFADLNGDGRTDLLQLVFQGVPPDEDRSIRAYLQSAEGRLPEDPTYAWPLPSGTAAYDVADVAPSPGEELLLLREKGVSILSLA